jgi:hypothetical protein
MGWLVSTPGTRATRLKLALALVLTAATAAAWTAVALIYFAL